MNENDQITCPVCKTYKAANLMPHFRFHHPEIAKGTYTQYGPLVSSTVRSKMSNSHVGLGRSEAHRANLAKALTGKKISESHRESLRRSHLGYQMPEAQRDSISVAHANRLLNGGKNFGYVTGDLVTRFGTIFYRSKLEREFLELAAADTSIVSLEQEPFILRYLDANNKQRRYLPDFLLTLENGRKLLVEVKPEGLTDYQGNKVVVAEEWCLNNNAMFFFVTERHVHRRSSTMWPWVTMAATVATLTAGNCCG